MTDLILTTFDWVPRRPGACARPAGALGAGRGRLALLRRGSAVSQRMEAVLAGREWLARTFSIADVLMADALRLVARFDRLSGYPACHDHLARATARLRS